MARLRAGDLRSQLTIQTKSESSDGQGGSTFSWLPTATVWGKVVPADTSGETTEADHTVSRRRYTVTIRKRSLSSAARVVWRGLTLEVLAVLDSDEFLDATVLDCRELPAGVVAGGLP